MLANLEVKWLYDVIALEESRSFTLAAKARNISQSSFSRRIQSLEASLGFSIFDRSANPLQLTNRGKIFVGYARNMLDDMDFQISRIKGLNNTTQKIRIDAAPSLSVLLDVYKRQRLLRVRKISVRTGSACGHKFFP